MEYKPAINTYKDVVTYPGQIVPGVSLTESISDEEVMSFMSAMNKRYGLDFTHYEIRSLKRGVSRLLMKHGMKSMLDLWSRILKDDSFFKQGIDDLLVNLTELFRNPEAWKYIGNNILSKYKADQPLKIWHAGCSTGEEVYTMAIVMEQCGLLRNANVLATDLSTKALRRARSGTYAKEILESNLEPYLSNFSDKDLSDYFNFDGHQGVVKSAYKQHVTFRNHNLVSEGMTTKFDIVFCRNVMIYFDEALKNRVLTLLHNSLNPGGILVIGYYDIMTDHGKSLFATQNLKTKIYRKR